MVQRQVVQCAETARGSIGQRLIPVASNVPPRNAELHSAVPQSLTPPGLRQPKPRAFENHPGPTASRRYSRVKLCATINACCAAAHLFLLLFPAASAEAQAVDSATPTASRQPPYPHSTVINSITWLWDTRQTAALGSDLWPVTWGPDNHLYAAWGDGGGFGGSDSDGRVAMGIARVEGRPNHWHGSNVNGGKNPEHPASFPKKGKTSGLLFVDGVLFSLVNLQDGPWPDVTHVLEWSADKGGSWTQADWDFGKGEGRFQPGKFLNAGRNYHGLPDRLDRYVYIYGPRQPGQTGTARQLYLARVPRRKLRDRSAYEFFTGLSSPGQPRWQGDETLAQPVFEDTNGLSTGAVVYVPGLKRFLLASFHTGPGQLGVFDAPSPWGPWTTIQYEEHWGQMGESGEGLNCEFPQKWMSRDGLTLWAVFSVYGDGAKIGVKAHDRFNLIQARLTLATGASRSPGNVH